MKKSWFEIKNKGTNEPASVSIHDEIGIWGVSAKQFIEEIKALGEVKRINLSIHSPGGSVFDGLAIYNTLVNHPAKISGKVSGIAASAASFVLMAADEIEMPEDSFLMIHNTHGGAYGNAVDLREMADLMDKLGSQIANIYQKRTGQDEQTILDMMTAETWMNASEAKELGFADYVTNAVGVAAKADNFDKYFKEMPFNSANNTMPALENIRDLEKHLRDSGYSRTKATEIVAKLKTSLQRESETDATMHQLSQLSDRLCGLSIPKSLV